MPPMEGMQEDNNDFSDRANTKDQGGRTNAAASQRKAFRLTAPLPEPMVKGKLMVIYNRRDTLWGWLSMKQGFFSEFMSVLGALRYAETHDAAGVFVNFLSDMYTDGRTDENWWSYYFAPTMSVSDGVADPPEIHFNNWIYRFGPWAWNRSWSSVILPSYPPHQPYPINATEEMRIIADLVSRYIKVNREIEDKVDAFYASSMAGEYVIGIHYRGTDKKLLYPYTSPSYRLFEETIDGILRRCKQDRFKVFIATDEIEFLEWAQARYPRQVICYDDAPRLSAQDADATRGGTHKSHRFSGRLKGESAVMDCLLLSRCNYLIKNRSSLSDIALAFNPSLDWTMILGENDPIYSSEQSP